MWRGTPKETSTSPTATSILGSRNTTRTVTGSNHGALAAPGQVSSIIRTPAQAVLGRPSIGMPFGNGDIRRRDLELARAKIDHTSGGADHQRALEMTGSVPATDLLCF